MCQVAPSVMDLLEKTVKQFLSEGRMFTGYDVTIETRNREHMSIRHFEVREGIHEIQSLKDALNFGWDHNSQTVRWNRIQIDVGAAVQPWLFYPAHLNPKSYVALDAKSNTVAPPLKANPPQLVASISAVNSTPAKPAAPTPDGTFAIDDRHRLLIPTRFLKEAGMVKGDIVYVAPDSNTNTVLLCKYSHALQTQGIQVITQTVEKHGDLRISSKTLRLADIDGSKFIIETNNKSIGGVDTKVVEVKKVEVANSTSK